MKSIAAPADGAESGGGASGSAATGIGRRRWQGTVNADVAHHVGASRRGLLRRVDGGGPAPGGDGAAGRRRAGARPPLRQPDRRSGRRLDRRGHRRGAGGRAPGGDRGRRAARPPLDGGRAGGCAGPGRRGRRRGPRPRRAVRARGRLPAVRRPAPHHRPGGVGGGRRGRPLRDRRRRGARSVRPAGSRAARVVGPGDADRRDAGRAAGPAGRRGCRDTSCGGARCARAGPRARGGSDGAGGRARRRRARRLHGKQRRGPRAAHRRTAGPCRARGDDAGRRRRRHGSRDPARRRPPPRRGARRAGLRDGAPHHRVHPATARPRRPRDGADRGVDHVRRHERLRLRPGLGLGPREPVGRQRDAPRHHAAPPERHLHRLLRHLLRPPQRLQLLHQPAGGALGLAVHQRGQPQQRLEPGVGRADGPLRGRLDGRDGDPVQDPPLPLRAAPPLGHPAPPRHPAQERVGVPDPAAHLGRRRQRGRRHLPGLGRGHPRRPRAAPGEPQHRGQAVRHRGHLDRPDRGPGGEQRRERQRGHRRQVRHHPEPDRRLHLQHRLRAGRGGRAPGQPDPVPAVLPREARVLPGGAGHLRLRAGGRHPPAGRTRRGDGRASSAT